MLLRLAKSLTKLVTKLVTRLVTKIWWQEFYHFVLLKIYTFNRIRPAKKIEEFT